mmetsp:Transcript_29502/g.53521  ORF Transcript_29502/g.53521 Transcript_29502/m.53521 type:complete len:1028 (-) Transcript_29502:86-3169(-)|eukprot:CAMPEP_0201917306 /NCGR_PEP_ID=MMETSP0903-20130614/6716_1 /ASSEMBLY_ACC=CAM_ASM_000552 /TAXON_ID=420261 /ORGANISM="Thalassiosira antarctica, Strain CCMP982" /LENGTH=1027 /DNA_ID=CAMNT_0048453335 /DNA_START=98 /DNA_END=3181 /DNA_ORIENTATION=-
MKRSISRESSGDGDEFFDAVEHLEDNSNCNSDEKTENEEYCRLQSLDESKFEENFHSSDRRTQLQDTEEMWVTAKAFAKETSDRSFGDLNRCTRSTSLLDSVPTESVSDEENSDKQINSQNSDSDIGNCDNSEMGGSDQETEMEKNDSNEDKPAAPTHPIVPPLNLNYLPSGDHDIYSVPTKEMEQIVRKEYDEEDLLTLNRLVDKLQAAELSKPPKEEEVVLKEDGSTIYDYAAIDDQAITVLKESVQADSPEQYYTPQKIDCGNITDFCVKSPLEALYLFFPRELSYNSKGGSQKWSGNASPPTRTSIVNEDGLAREEFPSPPLSEHEQTETDGRRLDLDSVSSDDSSASGDKYQMVNKDTGRIYDVRDVMKQIAEAGSSDALDTMYSFLPTKDQLEESQRRSKTRLETKSKESDGSETPAMSLATASFDSAIVVAVAEETSLKLTERKRSGIKFSKVATSKMAASVLKGVVAGLKSSHQQKLNRKRTTSPDMLPSNAIRVRSSSSRQKQSRFIPSVTSEHSQDVPADSSFNPMLLIRTIPNAHKGPAWCASFSQNGRFLATGGEDGNVCIWAVSPESKAMHPDGVTSQQEESPSEQSGNEDTENTETVNDEENEKASAPPLHFVGAGPELATNLEILSSDPIQRFQDHTADVIDLSWSHTNFLLSASLDKSVRLYHFSKPGCLHLFKHAHLVASVAFHPSDDRYFISGGIDKKLRLWDITDGRVKEWAQAPDAITAARFTPDGKYAVAGLFRGQVYFYDTNGLKYYTQIACRNRSGKHRAGKKVTGISFVRGERDDWLQAQQESVPEHGETAVNDSRATLTERLSDSGRDVARKMTSAFRHGATRAEALRYTERMLVSTNDSRVRLYGLSDFCLVRKYKGHTNYSMQIRARVSESGNHIACGSESGHVFIWDTLDKNRLKKSNVSMKVHQTHDKTKSSDNFEASKASLPIVTDSAFFPSRSISEALLSSDQVFPFSLGMDRVDDDLSSAAILTLDYDGTMRVFLRKSCIDNILDAATPRGGTMT